MGLAPVRPKRALRIKQGNSFDISTDTLRRVAAGSRVAAAMVDELSLEDRINEEVRVILDAFQEDMRKSGASYPEMFKKVKNELARKYKAVL